jgi:DMSO/TMAO reductase YedYZ heme-binding membrane subunit
MPAAVLVVAAVFVVAAGLLIPIVAAIARFLDFYAGVFALVALSVSVMVGLLATDQLVLTSRQRLLAQAVHRAVAFVAVATLLTHVLSQVLRHRIGVIDAIVPFEALDSRFAIGLGTFACYLMIMIAVTGIVRGRFAAGTRPWLWRGLHCLAYVAWPLAIAHGLTAGRSPAGWVTTSYGLCVAAVATMVIVRFLPRPRPGRPG